MKTYHLYMIIKDFILDFLVNISLIKIVNLSLDVLITIKLIFFFNNLKCHHTNLKIYTIMKT